MDLKERARKLKTDIPAIFLALKDKETPEVVFCNSDCVNMACDNCFAIEGSIIKTSAK